MVVSKAKTWKKNWFVLQNVKRMSATKDYGPATLYFVVILLVVILFLRIQNLSLYTNSLCTIDTNCKVPRCISLNAHISVALTTHFVPLRNLARTSACVPAPIHWSTKLDRLWNVAVTSVLHFLQTCRSVLCQMLDLYSQATKFSHKPELLLSQKMCFLANNADWTVKEE